MKQIIFSCILLITSTTGFAMEKYEPDLVAKITLCKDGNLQRTVFFDEDTLTFNNTMVAYAEASEFLDTIDSILEISRQRYDYLLGIWKTSSHDLQTNALHCLQNTCLDEMKFLKERFMRNLYDNFTIQTVMTADKARTHKFFVDVLNIFEKFHELRISACKKWLTIDTPQLVSQCYLGTSMQENFQMYADVLQANVRVKDWYERMRANDI